VLVRFSEVIHPAGSPETVRDPRGFALKFFMEEDSDHYADFMTLTPESLHMLTWLFSDYGTPANYRQMEGYSVHAFKWVNEQGQVVYVKYRWVPLQGIRNLTMEEAAEIQRRDFNHATRDLFEHIRQGDYLEWDLYVQIMKPEELDELDFDPLDATKVWPEDRFPWQPVGRMTLNRNPQNYFAEVEQSAFSPSALVPGIEPSEDKLLQGRLFSYPDTQRHRLGPNYLNIPINCPYAPVRNYQRDGWMQTRQQTSTINYQPNRYDDEPKPDPRYRESETPLTGSTGRKPVQLTNDFQQAGERYRSFSEQEKNNLIRNLVRDLQHVHKQTKLLAICNFYRADREFGERLAEGLGIDIRAYVETTMR